jgi:hypothetical protein
MSFRNIPESGSGAWKDNVALTTDLPLLNNVNGDKRQALDTKTIYSWDGAGWVAIASPAAAIAITGLLGDVTATGPGAVNATLKTVNVSPGTIGGASTSTVVTVNGKGLVTSTSTTPIQIAQSQVDNLVSDLAGKQAVLGFTPENVANKATNLTSPDNTKYPTTQAVSTAISGKQDTITGGASSIVTANLTANRALISDASGKVATNTVTSTELGYLSGVTSAIQTQLNGKYNNPTGTTAQYIRGDGSLATLPSSGGVWGTITGTLSSQTDLQTALNGKFNNPTGTAADYVAGDGSIIAFPSVAAADRLVTTAYNETGAIIPKMSVVYLDGPHGNLPKIVLAQANNELDSTLTYGITQSAIGDMTSGIIVEAGRLENLNTNVAGWNEGDILYLSPTVPGGITATKPYAPDQVVFVGILVRKHPTQGVIQVKVQNGYELDELHNVQILTPPANGSALVYEASTSLWKPSLSKLAKGTKTIFCIDNGDYATLQAAVDAAVALSPDAYGFTIVVGAKSGSWGDVIIPDTAVGRKFSIIGLQSARCPFVRVGAITFSRTLETQLTENELYLQNLYISSSTSACVTFGGNKGARIRIDGCFIDAGSTMNALSLSNTVSTSSVYIYNSLVQSANGTTVVSSTPYVRIYRSAVENTGTILLSQTAGYLESNDVNWSGARVGEIISITAGANFICGKSLIANTTTNGSGVLLTGATAVMANSNNTWQIATGTGYCIRGTGTHLYGPILTANSAALAYNVKIQNTLTASLPYTTAFTSSP